MENENKSYHIDQLQTDVSLLSFMAAVSIFLNGLLLTKFDSYDVFIKVPISFLIISTLGFLFSSLILANTTQHIIDNKFAKAKKHILWGYAISEYMGVYLFVLSIPLAVNVITSDLYLRIVTLTATLLGMLVYQFMGFSILERHFPKTYRKFSIAAILFLLALFISQIWRVNFIEISIAFLLFILVITYLGPKENFK